MPGTLAGRTIALAEGRQIEDLAALLEKEGATTARYPLVQMTDAPDTDAVVAWLNDLCAGRFDLLLLMTGEAVRHLLGFAERAGLREAYVSALAKTRIITRGPKPGHALRALGLTPRETAMAPTTAGVIDTLRGEPLEGKTVAFTLTGGPNPTLEGFLRQAGADPRPVLSYVYAPATDTDRVMHLIQGLDEGSFDAIVFTSSPQVDRLFEVAAERGCEAQLRRGLERTSVAAVGPIVAATLREKQIDVNVCPSQGFVMKNLVQQMKRADFP